MSVTVIDSFSGQYRFLSNFYSSVIDYEGFEYPTVEHAFQAAKTHDLNERRKIAASATPGDAKRRGRKVKLRDDWEVVCRDVMLALVREKFSIPFLTHALLGTGDAQLIEGNTWGDQRWGCVKRNGQWVGNNWLGQALMQVRDELRTTSKEQK